MGIDDGAELEGRYRILRSLGEGGMGAVYEAEHTALGRRVAIKVLHAHVARVPDAVRRFEREARAAAEIGHPNIVEVFDVGTHLGEPFLVMELLRGETLADRLSRPELIDARAACRIVGYVLSALASAHAKGIIHRDLKPENVFLVPGDPTDGVKLLDFGISKFRRAGATLLQTTQEGIPLGTPGYMAPEQWMGRRDIDHRADIFAVGVMLYELLTGGLPYEGANQGELFLEIVRGTSRPTTPSELEETVPPALDAVVLRALDRDRDRRFGSAREFLEALRPFGADLIPVVDAAPAIVEEDAAVVSARRAMRAAPTDVALPPRRRVPAELVGAAVAVLVAMGAGGWWLSRATAPPPTVVTRPSPTPTAAATAAATADAPVPAASPSTHVTPAVTAVPPDVEPPRAHPAHRRSRRTAVPPAANTGAARIDRLPVSRSFEP